MGQRDRFYSVCPVITSLVATSLFAAALLMMGLGDAQTAVAQPLPSAPEFKLIAEPLLLETRKTVTSADARVQAVSKKVKDFDAIAKRLVEQGTTTRQASEKAALEESDAVKAAYASKVEALSIDGIKQLHATLQSHAATLREQALTSSSPIFISGDPFTSRRPAMAQIVDSERAYLQQVGKLIRESLTWLGQVQNDVGAMVVGIDPRTLPLGLDHYMTVLMQTVEAQRMAFKRASPHFAGIDPDGQPVEPTFDCSLNSPSAFRSFKADMAIFTGWAKPPMPFVTTDGSNSWVRGLSEAALKAYEGNPQTDNPGYITVWTACLNSKISNVQVLTADINRELQRGNTELAKSLNLQRAQLEYESTILKAEVTMIVHRRDQIKRFLAAAAPQGTPAIVANFPDAWRRTVEAHARNLDEVGQSFPGLFRTAIVLIDSIESELKTLVGKKDDELKAQAALVVDRLQALRASGFERFLGQIDSAADTLNIVAAGATTTQTLLSDAIATYELVSAKKASFWNDEEPRVKTRSVDAETRQQKAKAARSEAVKKLADLEAKAKVYQEKRPLLDDALKRYVTTIAANRYNTVYTGVVKELVERATKKSKVINTRRVPIELNLLRYLGGFAPIEGTTPATPTQTPSSCKPSGRKCRNPQAVKVRHPIAKTLLSLQQAMVTQLPSVIDSVTQSKAGTPLSTSVANIEALAKDIGSL